MDSEDFPRFQHEMTPDDELPDLDLPDDEEEDEDLEEESESEDDTEDLPTDEKSITEPTE